MDSMLSLRECFITCIRACNMTLNYNNQKPCLKITCLPNNSQVILSYLEYLSTNKSHTSKKQVQYTSQSQPTQKLYLLLLQFIVLQIITSRYKIQPINITNKKYPCVGCVLCNNITQTYTRQMKIYLARQIIINLLYNKIDDIVWLLYTLRTLHNIEQIYQAFINIAG